MSLQEFINNNHKRLLQACKNIKYDLYGELYSELYIYLDSMWEKYKELPQEQIIYLSINFLKKQFEWIETPLKKTLYNKKVIQNGLEKVNLTFTDEMPYNTKLYYDDRIEISAENFSKLTEEYLLDLNNNFNETEVKQIINTYLIYDKLDLKEQIIFDMYIQQELSIRDIAAKIKVSYSSARTLINETINKIKQLTNGTITN